MTGNIEIDVFDSIERITRESWDAVAGDSVGINYALLLCRERNSTGTIRPRYFLVRSSDESMAVSVAVIASAADEAPLTPRLFGRRARRIGSIFKSIDCALVCGRIPGPGAAVMVRRDTDEQRWVRIICGAMEEYARAHDLTMAYASVLPEQSSVLGELRRRKYLCGIDRPIATLDVTWQDTQSYLETLRRSRGKNYVHTTKSEIRRFRKSGARVSRFAGSDYAEVFDLLHRHNTRKNARDLVFRQGILEDLATQLGDDCIVYVAHKVEVLIGVVVFVCRDNTARAWLIGIDHDADAKSFCYFNLCYYYPCGQFPALGIRKIFFGNAAQYAKYRRGCDIVETRFLVRTTPGWLNLVLRPLFALQRIFFRRKYRAALPQRTRTR